MGGTKPAVLLKNHTLMRTDFWDVSVPGFMEADTVAHCGNLRDRYDDSRNGQTFWHPPAKLGIRRY